MSYIKLIHIVLVLSIAFTSCKTPPEVEAINQQRVLLSEASKFLNMDMDLISSRKKYIEENYNCVKVNLKDTVGVEFGRKMDKYKWYKKKYAKIIAQHQNLSKEATELTTQMDNLEHDIRKSKITKDEFKFHFKKEKADILKLRTESETMNKQMYELEPEYKRFDEDISKILTELGCI